MRGVAAVAGLLFAFLCANAAAQSPTPAAPPAIPVDPAARIVGLSRDFLPPDDVSFRVVTIVSEGVRLHGEVFSAKTLEGRKLPTIIMGHGWGGIAASFRPDAVALARAGYLVITFDYRGWGESDSRVVLLGPEPAGSDNAHFTAEVQAIRGYIDPFEQIEDWFNVVDWAMDAPMVDTARVGLRGSSFSGGYVVFVAARDPRIKAIVSQVGGIADRPDFTAAVDPRVAAYVARAHQQAADMAWGRAFYPEPRAKAIGNLIGTPIGDKLLRWWPNDESAHVHVPALFILAANEELNDNRTNGELAYERAQGPKKLVTIPGIRHYGIYNEAREQAIKLAIDWFDKYLKP
jgi:dienelactone hydrolase